MDRPPQLNPVRLALYPTLETTWGSQGKYVATDGKLKI